MPIKFKANAKELEDELNSIFLPEDSVMVIDARESGVVYFIVSSDGAVTSLKADIEIPGHIAMLGGVIDNIKTILNRRKATCGEKVTLEIAENAIKIDTVAPAILPATLTVNFKI